MSIISVNPPAFKDILLLLHQLFNFILFFFGNARITSNSYSFYFLANVSWLLGGAIILLYDLIASFNKTLKSSALKSTLSPFNKIEHRPQHKKRLLIYFLLVGFVLLNWLTSYGYTFLFQYALEDINVISKDFFSLSLTALISWFALKREIHRHNFLALALILLGAICLSIPFFPMSETLWLSLGIGLMQAVSISFRYVFLKYVMENKHMRPLMLLLFLGVIGIVILLIIYSIFLIFEIDSYQKENIVNVFTDLLTAFSSWYDFGMVLALLIGMALMNLCAFSIIYFYDAICLINSNLLNYIFQLFYMSAIWKSWNYILTYILISDVLFLIGNLIYVEVLVLYFCGFGSNTKREIIQRSEIEKSEEEMGSVEVIEMYAKID